MSYSEHKTYTLKQFHQLNQLTDLTDFDDDVLKKINDLAALVGAPSYKKTPIFKHRSKKNKKISEEEWTAIRNFKQTELQKNENEFEKEIDNLRSLLNKLTKKQYDEVKNEIIKLIDKLVENYEENTECDNNLKLIGKMIFEIGSMNKFWSELYALLYKDVIEKYPIMKSIMIQNFNDFIDVFKNIESCDANENYDKFCILNKLNEKRKGLSNFFIILADKKVLGEDKMVDLIQQLIKNMDKFIEEENKINEVDEICENLFILISRGTYVLSKHSYWEEIIDVIDRYTLLKSKDFKSLSNKTIFKFMDLQETLEDMSDQDSEED